LRDDLAMFARVASAICLCLAISTSVVHGSPRLAERDDNLPARVPYVFPPPGTNALADQVRQRRPNDTLLDLDGVLFNSQPLAEAWNGVAVLIRDNNPIPGNMRELLILRSAVLNNAAYQWIQHEPVGREEGLTTSQLQTIRFAPPFANLSGASHAPASPYSQSLTHELEAALAFADWATLAVNVPDGVYAGLARYLNSTGMIYAVSTVGYYAWVSRFVVGLNIDDKMNVVVPIPT